MNICRICFEETDCKNLDLYVSGSEGLTICHSCEMKIVEFVRALMSVAANGRKTGFLACKRIREAKEGRQ